MKLGISFLVLGYFLSQFYRSFLAVLTPVLGADIGATAADLSLASGLWFAIFAVMQIPVGWALDHIGPRTTTATLLALGGGGGAVVFALAQTPTAIQAAMFLFGIGCSPVLMAAYYIFARTYPAAMFSTLAGAIIGLGSAGNLAGSAPLAWAVEAYGWRETMWAMAAISVIVAALLFIVLRDPPKIEASGTDKGRLSDLIKLRPLWFIVPIMLIGYAPAAGLRGLWAGPYFGDVFGLDQIGIGNVTLWMAAAMALGSFAYGPMDRLVGSVKTVVIVGNLVVVACCFALWYAPSQSWLLSAILFAVIGFFGTSFPVIMSHAKAFFPQNLTGRGMSLLNLFGIGGVGVMQFATGALNKSIEATATQPDQVYSAIFLLFGVCVLIGCAIYAFSTEIRD